MNDCESFRGFITCKNQQSDHFPGLLRSSVGRGMYQYRRGHFNQFGLLCFAPKILEDFFLDLYQKKKTFELLKL